MATTHESDGSTPDAGFTSLSDYMAAREGEMSWDDVRVAPDAPAAAVPPAAADGGGSVGGGSPSEPPVAAAATPQVDAPPVAPAPAAPVEPSAQQVSEAARTLSQHGRQKTRAQQRQDEIQAKIDELTAKRHEVNSGYEAEQKRRDDLKAENDRLAREIEERRRQPAPAVAPAPAAQPPRAAAAPVVPVGRPEPPRVEDVGTDAIPTWDDYARLNAAWQVQLAAWTTSEASRRAEEVARRAVDHERVVSTWESRQAAAREKYPDFDAVAFSDDIVVSEWIAQKIVRDPQGPDIAYYLGKNPSEARRIASLAPDDQLVEFGSLRVKATAAAAAPAGPVAPQAPPAPTAPAIPKSQAPAPVSPVGSAPTASRVPLESRSLSNYIDEANEEEDRRGRR